MICICIIFFLKTTLPMTSTYLLELWQIHHHYSEFLWNHGCHVCLLCCNFIAVRQEEKKSLATPPFWGFYHVFQKKTCKNDDTSIKFFHTQTNIHEGFLNILLSWFIANLWNRGRNSINYRDVSFCIIHTTYFDECIYSWTALVKLHELYRTIIHDQGTEYVDTLVSL